MEDLKELVEGFYSTYKIAKVKRDFSQSIIKITILSVGLVIALILTSVFLKKPIPISIPGVSPERKEAVLVFGIACLWVLCVLGYEFIEYLIIKRINKRKIQAEKEMTKFSEGEKKEAEKLYNLFFNFNSWEIERFLKKIEKSKDSNLKKWTYYQDFRREFFGY